MRSNSQQTTFTRATFAFLPKIVIGGLALACSGRGEGGPVILDDSMRHLVVSDTERTLLPFDCSGTIVKTAAFEFTNSEDKVEPYTCLERADPSESPDSVRSTIHFVDRDRRAVDLVELQAEDERAFRDRHFRMLPDLEAAVLKARTVEEKVVLDVWFAHSESATSPTKAEYLLQDDAGRKRISKTKRDGFRSEALAFLKVIRGAVPGAKLFHEPTGVAPMLQVEVTAGDVATIGLLDGVTAVGLAMTPEKDEPMANSDVYWDLDKAGDLWTNGSFNGTDVKVMEVAGTFGVHDSTDLHLAPGDCVPPHGPSYACACPAGAGSEGPGGHPQRVLGMLSDFSVANPRGGTSKYSLGMVGGSNTACPGSSLESSVEWGLDQGVNVINRSASNGETTSRYLDFISAEPPFPLVVVAAGNAADDGDPEVDVASRIRNGLIVGAADDRGDSDRNHLKNMADFSQWHNFRGGADGYEVPHVVAPGVGVRSVPDVHGGSSVFINGTSFSTPQVSGIAADLMEQAPILKMWPEAAMAIIVASPGQSVDGVTLNMNDGIDDKDGSGNVNGRIARLIAANQVSDDNSPVRAAFSFGQPTNNGSSLSQVIATHKARASAGRTLRVVVDFFSKCGSAPCTTPNFPAFQLTVSSASTVPPLVVFQNLNSPYLYASVSNSSSSTRDYTITLTVTDWRGMPNDTYGIAWASYSDAD